MFKKHPWLLSSCLMVISFSLHAQEEERASSLTAKETSSIPFENITSSAFTPFTGAITGSKVRMRVSPNLEGHVVRETNQGEMFVITNETNDYYAVVPPKETKGYVFRTLILDGVVEAERVNVRLYPDMDAPVVGRLNTGDRVHAIVSEANSKWLEVSLPENSRFFIAKEYIENKGSPELFAMMEKKRAEAMHFLSAATLFAQAEIQKPFEQIDLDRINEKFSQLTKDYQEIPTLTEQARDNIAIFQDLYVQKKVAFLENKANGIAHKQSETIAASHQKKAVDIAAAATKTMGLSATFGEERVTDKMLLWQPLEESLYHLWAATNGEKSMEEFYEEEHQSAMTLTGIIEPYNRPVKNRPGDFLLRDENTSVAFLYSTSVNLEKLVGQRVTLLASPRPNHNFAFPAYFVISVE